MISLNSQPNEEVPRDKKVSTLKCRTLNTAQLKCNEADVLRVKYRRLDPPIEPDLAQTVLTGQVDILLSESGTVIIADGLSKTLRLPDLSQSANYTFFINSSTGIETSANNSIFSFARSGDHLYVAGAFTVVNGIVRNRIARISIQTGVVDPDWDPDCDSTVFSVAVDLQGGFVYFGGLFTEVGGSVFNRVARVPVSGSIPDPTWNPDANGTVRLRLDVANSFVYVAGSFTTIGGVGFNRLARIPFSTPVADASWNPDVNGTVTAIFIDQTVSPRNVYVGGSFTTIGGVGFNRLARVPSSGQVADASWNPDVNSTVNEIQIDSSVSPKLVYAGGAFTTVGGAAFNRLVRIPANSSTPDTSWNPDVNNTVSAIALDSSFLYAGGLFDLIDGTSAPFLARISKSSGSLDTGWNPNPEDTTGALFVDGNFLFVSGGFTSIGGLGIVGFAQLFTQLLHLVTFNDSQVINVGSTQHRIYSPRAVLKIYGLSATKWILLQSLMS